MMNIDEIEAGRELDALVAKAIFGDSWTHIAPDHVWDDIPHYSTDIAAAWEVVEKLGGDFYIEGSGDKYWCKFTDPERGMWDRNGTYDFLRGDANADTVSLAICRAAYRAMEQAP